MALCHLNNDGQTDRRHLFRQTSFDGEVEDAAQLAQQALEIGIDPLDAINRGFVKGLDNVGEAYGCGEMFLPDLVLAGEAMKGARVVLVPEVER